MFEQKCKHWGTSLSLQNIWERKSIQAVIQDGIQEAFMEAYIVLYCVILCYSNLEYTNLTLLECIDLLKEKRSISITLSNIKSMYRNKETCKNVWSGNAVKSTDMF